MFCAGPNFLSQSKKSIGFSASSKPLVPAQKTNLLNRNHLLVWHKMFWTGTKCNINFWTGTKHFGTHRRTRQQFIFSDLFFKECIITFSDACHNKECPFLHIDPESKIRDCPWYDRGFCRHGPSCRHRHVRRVLCLNFLAGFCPKGPDCADTHPKFELPPIGGPDDPRGIGKKIVITCHYCGEPGHKVSHCAKVPPEVREQHAQV